MMKLTTSTYFSLDEAGHPLVFQYFLLSGKVEQEGFRGTDYGIMVRSSDGTSACFPHITPDYQRITQLLTLLQEQGVSPIHLQDIIEDWL